MGRDIINILIGALIGFSFFAIQYFASRGKWVGGGDMFIGLFMGIVLGFSNVIFALFLSYMIGSIFAVTLLLMKKKRVSNPIPFGPFLTLSTYVAILFGENIVRWYLNLSY